MDQSVVKLLQIELGRLNERCARMEREHHEAEADRDAIIRTIAILRRKTRTEAPELSVRPSELVGMTQEQAIIHIATRGGGVLLSGPTKNLLVDAGLIQNPKNAASILYTLLQRSNRFDQIRRGEYQLRPEPILTSEAWFLDMNPETQVENSETEGIPIVLRKVSG